MRDDFRGLLSLRKALSTANASCCCSSLPTAQASCSYLGSTVSSAGGVSSTTSDAVCLLQSAREFWSVQLSPLTHTSDMADHGPLHPRCDAQSCTLRCSYEVFESQKQFRIWSSCNKELVELCRDSKTTDMCGIGTSWSELTVLNAINRCRCSKRRSGLSGDEQSSRLFDWDGLIALLEHELSIAVG